MKHLTVILSVAILFLTSGIKAQEAQLEGNKRERLQALKVGYLTEKLALSPKEAELFWPLYNEMEGRVREVRKERKQNRRQTKQNHDEMSDAQLKKAIETELRLEQEELDLKKEYTNRFQKILPIKKVVKLHALEESFKRELLKQARDKRRGPP